MTIITTVINFFNHPFFIIVGGLTTILMIAGFLYTAYFVIKGIFPVWYRLGMGLSKRKIAVFASTEFESLKSMLVDSKIFEGKNVIQINKNDLNKAEKDIRLFIIDELSKRAAELHKLYKALKKEAKATQEPIELDLAA